MLTCQGLLCCHCCSRIPLIFKFWMIYRPRGLSISVNISSCNMYLLRLIPPHQWFLTVPQHHCDTKQMQWRLSSIIQVSYQIFLWFTMIYPIHPKFAGQHHIFHDHHTSRIITLLAESTEVCGWVVAGESGGAAHLSGTSYSPVVSDNMGKPMTFGAFEWGKDGKAMGKHGTPPFGESIERICFLLSWRRWSTFKYVCSVLLDIYYVELWHSSTCLFSVKDWQGPKPRNLQGSLWSSMMQLGGIVSCLLGWAFQIYTRDIHLLFHPDYLLWSQFTTE